MSANKFATMVHRNTNKITLILVYAILEWVLIILLLLNSLFSYLIIKFADYFGLKRPCLWCSRLDHLFEPSKFQNSYRSLVCEAHAIEISKLGYCSDHRKLAESQDMCEDCSSSLQSESLNKFAFFPWMKQLGVAREFGGCKQSDNGEMNLKCSCCSASFNTKLPQSDYYMSKPSWGDSDYTQKGNLISEPLVDNKFDDDDISHRDRPGFVSDGCHNRGIDENGGVEVGDKEEETWENCSKYVPNFDSKEMVSDVGDKVDRVQEKEKEPVKEDNDSSFDQIAMAQPGFSVDTSSKIRPWHLEFYIDQDDCHLIPIELMESNSTEKQISNHCEKEEEENCNGEDFVLEFDKQVETLYELVVEERSNLDEEMPLLSAHESEEEHKIAAFDSRELMENESSSELHADSDLIEEKPEKASIAQAPQTSAADGSDVQNSSVMVEEEMESDNNQVYAGSKEFLQMQSEEIDVDISIGTEIPDQEHTDDIQTEDVPEDVPASCSCTQKDLSTSNADYHECDDDGSNQAEKDAAEFRTITIETSEPVINTRLPLCSESNNEVEEDKMPDTPTSVNSLHHLHKKLLLLERRESSTEESLDGSVISDIEAGDGVLSIEKLKSALRFERKALNALYAELEEERNASAVAASQTMAMINRLQEEKAAMQMEALQYQRMMEEQSEYDQEALQLLNELMVKREKEKADLEKELDVYRKKVHDYEAKERMLVFKRGKDSSTRSGTCSASCSNAEDSDELSVDLNHDGKELEILENHQEHSNQKTPADEVLYLEESLANFEDERLSILEQLKVLEEKLSTLSDEEQQLLEDMKPIEHLYEEKGNGYNENFYHSSEANGVANGHHKEMNGKHHQERKNIDAKAKRLLPLFDAVEAEAEDGMPNGHAESINNFDMDNKKLAIEEEVDHVYERLQALEADREFLKHCISSLRKGDKGIELLQEILHHLRDLRSVELRARNMEDGDL